MSTAAHTPTPWAEQEMPGGCNDRITADDGEGKTICEFPYGLDANSAHIVRCVNAHDDLVAALQMARARIRNLSEAIMDAKELGLTVAICGDTFDGNVITAALAKAGAA